jgi:hypothetical protein
VIVGDAREVARRWVAEEAGGFPGFYGAFFHGSVGWLDEDAELPENSDVDVMVVLDDPEAVVKPGKFRRRGVLLEVSFLPTELFRSAESILGRFQLASSFRAPSVISDPSGRLADLQAAVAAGHARRLWVRERCQGVHDNILRFLRSLDETAPFYDGVSAWLFATSNAALVPLVAGLENPTVRKRYVAARRVLDGYDRLPFYEILLGLLGCAGMGRERVEHHLDVLAGVFDAAKTVEGAPFFFAADISDAARPVAIDGSRELIGGGLHREAVFWIVATYARCLKILDFDGSVEASDGSDPGFRELLGDLGITSHADMRRRGGRVEAFLPRLRDEAEAIMAANPQILD